MVNPVVVVVVATPGGAFVVEMYTSGAGAGPGAGPGAGDGSNIIGVSNVTGAGAGDGSNIIGVSNVTDAEEGSNPNALSEGVPTSKFSTL